MSSLPAPPAPLAPLTGSPSPEAVLDRFLAVVAERGLRPYPEQEDAMLELFVSVRPRTYRSSIAEQFDVVMLSTSTSQC